MHVKIFRSFLFCIYALWRINTGCYIGIGCAFPPFQNKICYCFGDVIFENIQNNVYNEMLFHMRYVLRMGWIKMRYWKTSWNLFTSTLVKVSLIKCNCEINNDPSNTKWFIPRESHKIQLRMLIHYLDLLKKFVSSFIYLVCFKQYAEIIWNAFMWYHISLMRWGMY